MLPGSFLVSLSLYQRGPACYPFSVFYIYMPLHMIVILGLGKRKCLRHGRHHLPKNYRVLGFLYGVNYLAVDILLRQANRGSWWLGTAEPGSPGVDVNGPTCQCAQAF
jgi:hypothetical protein